MVKKKQTLKQVEQFLSDLDLLLWAVESDCKGIRYLAKVKSAVTVARKQIRDIPIPKEFRNG